jgi:hypothetical protein
METAKEFISDMFLGLYNFDPNEDDIALTPIQNKISEKE